MPVIGDPGNGAEDSPAETQELHEEHGCTARVPGKPHLQVPSSEDRLEDTQRGMSRREGLSTI